MRSHESFTNGKSNVRYTGGYFRFANDDMEFIRPISTIRFLYVLSKLAEREVAWLVEGLVTVVLYVENILGRNRLG